MAEKVKRGFRNEDGSYTYYYDRSSSLGGRPRADYISGNEEKKPKMKKKMPAINRTSRFNSGGDASCGCSSCMGESARGAGAAVKGTNFKGVF